MKIDAITVAAAMIAEYINFFLKYIFLYGF